MSLRLVARNRVKMADIDKTNKEVISLLKKIDWAKVVNYGSVKVQIREGHATKVTIEETLILEG